MDRQGADNLLSSLKVEQVATPPRLHSPLHRPAPTHVNLLVNPDGRTGDLSGWTILENGGEGWAVVDGVFRTSYAWNKRTQVVDLHAAGYDANVMATSPAILISERFMRHYSGRINGKTCLHWLESADPDGWDNNYLCY